MSKVIIAGSRDITSMQCVNDAVAESGFDITTVVSGGAQGVDSLAIWYAVGNSIEYVVYPALWERFGSKAGRLRNTLMAENADALIAVWDGSSPGTKHMISEARRLGLKVHVKVVRV
jgi:threonine/homoserine efflux transporter RhtA